MPTPQDVAAVTKIGTWNLQHGSGISRVTAAHARVVSAVDTYEADPNNDTLARLQEAGTNLQAAAAAALAAPTSGVPGYDNPYREGLGNYAKAAARLAALRPSGESTDGFDVAILLTRGQDVTSVATAYAQDLLSRF